MITLPPKHLAKRVPPCRSRWEHPRPIRPRALGSGCTTRPRIGVQARRSSEGILRGWAARMSILAAFLLRCETVQVEPVVVSAAAGWHDSHQMASRTQLRPHAREIRVSQHRDGRAGRPTDPLNCMCAAVGTGNLIIRRTGGDSSLTLDVADKRAFFQNHRRHGGKRVRSAEDRQGGIRVLVGMGRSFGQLTPPPECHAIAVHPGPLLAIADSHLGQDKHEYSAHRPHGRIHSPMAGYGKPCLRKPHRRSPFEETAKLSSEWSTPNSRTKLPDQSNWWIVVAGPSALPFHSR